jgi:HTH-type transcriptional regulator / antitoxin HipB
MNTIARATNQIGAVLRRVRRQKGLTQRELGDLMHVRQATVSKLESGEAGTQLGVLITALAALDLELVIRARSKASTDEIDELF